MIVVAHIFLKGQGDARRMRRCPNCGAFVATTDVACWRCGAQMTPAGAPAGQAPAEAPTEGVGPAEAPPTGTEEVGPSEEAGETGVPPPIPPLEETPSPPAQPVVPPEPPEPPVDARKGTPPPDLRE
ncbi:MAG TPA: hypothetical protein EYP43_03370, partial [Thermoplasmata archaeon]|nr:hypothetical protein [Thermoplasmata archaeon]